MATGFTFLIRTQYSFQGTERSIARFLDAVAEGGISITAYDIYKVNCVPSINLVVGFADRVVNEWDAQVEVILNGGNYRWCKKSVLQVRGAPAGTVGVIRTIYGALFCEDEINHIYLSEGITVDGRQENCRILDVKDNVMAQVILSMNPIPQCPRTASSGSNHGCKKC
jgi:hypothetical protein